MEYTEESIFVVLLVVAGIALAAGHGLVWVVRRVRAENEEEQVAKREAAKLRTSFTVAIEDEHGLCEIEIVREGARLNMTDQNAAESEMVDDRIPMTIGFSTEEEAAEYATLLEDSSLAWPLGILLQTGWTKCERPDDLRG